MWVLDRVLLRHLFMILGQQESRPLEERIQPGSFALDIQKDSCCPCKVPEKADGFTSPGRVTEFAGPIPGVSQTGVSLTDMVTVTTVTR